MEMGLEDAREGGACAGRAPTTSAAAVLTDCYVETTTTVAVLWSRLKRAPPLPVPAVASSATIHNTVVHVVSSTEATPPWPSCGLVRGSGLTLPLSPGSLVQRLACGRVGSGRPRFLWPRP